MFRSYFLTAFRNLVKNRLNATINIVGLAVAFTVSILLFLLVRFEFSFDRFQQHLGQLYQIYHLSHKAHGDEEKEAMPYPMVHMLETEIPGVAGASAWVEMGSDVSFHGKEIEQDVYGADAGFFGMFSFPVVAGNGHDPLHDLNSAVVSQSAATAIFGKEDPIGKTIKVKVGPDWSDVVVRAVLQDAPQNSSIRYGVIARIELMPDYAFKKNQWNSNNHPVFVMLKPGVKQEQVEAEIRHWQKPVSEQDEREFKDRGYRKDAHGEYNPLRLIPLKELHFNELGSNNTNRVYLYTLLLIAIVVMVIACFNFINLNVARSFTRAKEVGIRKTIGAGRRQIFIQLWMESFLLFAVALIIALLAAGAVLQPFNDLFTEKLRLSTLLQPDIIAFALLGMALISFLAGGYPASLVARFKTTEVLKGKVSMRRSSLLRSGLITVQFVISGALICATLVIYRQFEHLRTAPLGLDQESVISIPVKRPENTHKYTERLRLEFASQPQVLGVTASSINIGVGNDNSTSASSESFSYHGKGMSSFVLYVDYDFFEVMGIHTIQGRTFSKDRLIDTSASHPDVVVTQMMANQFNEKQVAGISMRSDTASPGWNILGVVPDFHLYTMNSKLQPLTILMSNNGDPLSYIFVKVRTSNPTAAMTLVRSAFHQLEPDNTTEASWVTENTARWYAKERRLSSVFFAAAAVAILLSCLGLFAIVSLIMAQRQKEVGVRKVLGASIAGLTGLLSKDFVRLVVIAFLIATPISWYFLDRWLQNFVYRTTLAWWIFPLAGVVTLLIALVTVGIQTVRAAMGNPVKSLRSE